jgi:hypothetical protein
MDKVNSPEADAKIVKHELEFCQRTLPPEFRAIHEQIRLAALAIESQICRDTIEFANDVCTQARTELGVIRKRQAVVATFENSCDGVQETQDAYFKAVSKYEEKENALIKELGVEEAAKVIEKVRGKYVFYISKNGYSIKP